MRRDNQRKLQLNRETIRALTTREMAHVAGGMVPPKLTNTCKTCITAVGCPGKTTLTVTITAPPTRTITVA